ncbi:MAG: hypothetical protein P4L53_06800 [Candidatus Obscuribacterales bacterium]|nr:hypothetical protein [Candidatus Obscuribacterales bacterium]
MSSARAAVAHNGALSVPLIFLLLMINTRSCLADDVAIPENTKINIQFQSPISGEESKTGDAFSAKTTSDAVIDGKIVLPKSLTIEGTVVNGAHNRASRSHFMLVVFNSIILSDGNKIPLAADLVARGGVVTLIRNLELVKIDSPVQFAGMVPPRALSMPDQTEMDIAKAQGFSSESIDRTLPLLARKNKSIYIGTGDSARIRLTKDLVIH